MKRDTWKRLAASLNEPILIGGPVSKNEILAAEQTLGVVLVPDHREFIERYGAAMVGSLPVLGLRKAKVMGNTWSFVDVTQRFRRKQWPATEGWVVISMDLAGNPIGIPADGRDHSVYISDHDAAEILVVAGDFEAFVNQLLDDEERARRRA